ncbi:hypothetical protein LXL04_015114 [Taraxacum kok-saghyz]
MVSRISYEENLVDPFMKALTRPKHEYHIEAIGIHRVLIYNSIMLWCTPTLSVTDNYIGYIHIGSFELDIDDWINNFHCHDLIDNIIVIVKSHNIILIDRNIIVMCDVEDMSHQVFSKLYLYVSAISIPQAYYAL